MALYGYSHFKKLNYALLVLLVVIFVGIFGFMTIEGYSFSEAMYMTIITISTVGFQEIRPLSTEGRYFTAVLIVFSFGTFAYTISAVCTYLVDGELKKYFNDLRKKKKIRGMKDHIIICGFGRNGKQVAQDLSRMNEDFIVIEREEESFEGHKDKIKHFIVGDATSDQSLVDAGIERARALITTLPDDADNVFVVLTAREMKRELLIISRASIDNSDQKLRRAGANNVVMPDKVGGSHMASLVAKPDVVEFFNLLTGQANDISLEEISYDSLPYEFKDSSIEDLEIRKRCGANIVGLKSSSGEYVLNPSPSIKITEGSKLFVLGMSDQIEKLKEWK